LTHIHVEFLPALAVSNATQENQLADATRECIAKHLR
jgi:hypothetical protein